MTDSDRTTSDRIAIALPKNTHQWIYLLIVRVIYLSKPGIS
ncbi:hypothetical protein [Tolypothrix sp. VBCCA 56010]